jgi:TRAP-type C4-dicarboxylate transport system permease small subunit
VFAIARAAFDRALTAFVVFQLAALAVLILVGVVLRKLGVPFVWYDEGASIMLAWLTYYGAALAALKRAHIGFPGLVDALLPRWRVPAVWLGEVCVIGFFALLGWFGLKVLWILGGDTMVSLPWVPTRFTQSVIPVGAALFIVAQLLSLPETLRRARSAGVGGHDPVQPAAPQADR